MSTTRINRRLGWSLTIYCTREENAQIRAMAAKSTSRSLSEYARKVLTRTPVAIKHRNVSLDALIEELNGLRQQLERISLQETGALENGPAGKILQNINLIATKIIELCTPV